MKKILLALVVPYFFTLAAPIHALETDVKASKEERMMGRVYVKSPKPETDVITLTNKTGQTQTLANKTDTTVPVGSYNVTVKMDGGASFSQDFEVHPTERYEIIVPGYGNIRFNSTQGELIVNQAGTQTQVAILKPGEVRTLPTANYDLIIKVGPNSMPMNAFSVITNTTRDVNL